MNPRLRSAAVATACLAIGLWSSSRPVHTQSSPSYGVTDLGTLGGAESAAFAVTSGGFPYVAGWAETPAGTQHAFYGNPWRLNDIGTLGGARSVARGMYFYDFVGHSETASGETHAFLLHYGSPLQDLGTLGGPNSTAAAVNDQFVVGESDAPGGAKRAFLYDRAAARMSDLGASLGGTNSSASAINASQHVAGYADVNGNQVHHAFRFAGGATTDLGSFGSWSEARDIDDSDVVVGTAGVPGGGRHAFVYEAGSLRDLGTLGGQDSEALAINNEGTIVGWALDASGVQRAAIWRNGVAEDLNGLVPPGTGWELLAATDVASSGGAIVGYGRLNGATRAFMLTPPIDFSLSLSVHMNDLSTNFPNPIEAGQPLTVGATVHSNGPYSVTGVTVTQTLTGPVQITGWYGADSCVQDGLTLTCRVRSIDFDRDVMIRITTTGPGVFTHSATVTADQPDPNLSNNSGTESNTAVSLASLDITQTTIVAGGYSLARTTLTSQCPSGGAHVTLTSSNPAVATVPSSFDVMRGCCDDGLWREFYVHTNQVTAPTTVQISASYGLVTKTVPVTVVPSGSGPGTPSPYRGTPSAVPGTMEAEDFDNGGEGVAYHDLDPTNNGGAYRAEGVDIEATGDSGGGFNVGWMSAGEWLAYTANVAAAGMYQIEARVASPGAGGTFHVEFAGASTGTMTVPSTGGWQAWTTISTPVILNAGTQLVRVVVDSNGASGSFGNLNWIRLSSVSGGTRPFGGARWPLPGIIQAENFDEGGENVAYHDTSAGNNGGQYRATDVDVEAAGDSGGGFNVGWIAAGEWLNYSVIVGANGAYTLEARVASQGQGGTFHVEVDGTNATGTMTIPNTGGWQAWTTLAKQVNLTSGVHVMRVVFDTAGPGGAVGNVNWIRVSAPAGGQPYGGTALPLPGRIEAENFDNGGEGVGYHDTTPGNSGGQYRSTDVDIEAASDAGGGYDVGWMTAGEWLDYTVNVQQAGSYVVRARVAASGPGGTFHVESNGSAISSPLRIPDTGGWQAWTDITTTVTLAAGAQTLRLVCDASGSTGVFGNVNYLDVLASGSGTPASNVVLYGADFSRSGSWTLDADPTAAAGQKQATPDAGWSTTNAPLATPTDYLEASFPAEANVPYTVWLRLRATNDSKYNESVWVQLSGAQSNGSAVYPVGSSSGLLVNLEACSGCGVSGWGWQNGAYWLSQASTVTFATAGTKTIRIQVREDGVQLDQVVLSPSQYLTSPPGPVTQDSTIVPK